MAAWPLGAGGGQPICASFLRLRPFLWGLLQPYAWTSTILINEFNAGALQCAAHGLDCLDRNIAPPSFEIDNR
jgi:hypothetical protein